MNITSHKKSPQKGSLNLKSFLVSETGPFVLSLRTRTAFADHTHLQGRPGVLWAHQGAHTNSIIFFVHVRAFGYGGNVKNASFHLCGGEDETNLIF